MKNLENTSTQNSHIEKANESKRYNIYIKDVSEKAKERFKTRPFQIGGGNGKAQ